MLEHVELLDDVLLWNGQMGHGVGEDKQSVWWITARKLNTGTAARYEATYDVSHAGNSRM